jgi:hypothetical protein
VWRDLAKMLLAQVGPGHFFYLLKDKITEILTSVTFEFKILVAP